MFSYGLLHMDIPVLADKTKTYINFVQTQDAA